MRSGVFGFLDHDQHLLSGNLPRRPPYNGDRSDPGRPRPPDPTLTGSAQPPQGDMVWWYRQPAATFWEGLPIATGRFAAMVYGRVRDEVIPFNDETLWTGSPNNPNNPDGPKLLPEIRRCGLAGQFTQMSKLCEQLFSLPTGRVQTYQAMGRLHLQFDAHDTAADYRRELDMDNATARVSYRIGDARFTREIFASYPDQVIVIRLTCDKPGRIAFTTWLSSLHTSAASHLDGRDTIRITGGTNEDGIPARMKWEARPARAGPGRHHHPRPPTSPPPSTCGGADAVTLILAGATNYKSWNDISADPAARCQDYLRASAKPYEELRTRHVEDYQPRFRACRLFVGTTQAAQQDTTTRLAALRKGADDPHFVAQYFQYGRYLLLAGSRPGTLAFNNHNIWLDDLKGRWRGRWTLNINIQECYWCAENTKPARDE